MQIAPEHWPTLSRLFDEALELGPDARERWLATLPEASAGLVGPLRALLQSHARVETKDFLGAMPQFELGAEARSEETTDSGTVIGPYVVEAEIGRGGMGVVWRARRHDGQLKRDVALKLPRAAVRDRDLLARFARERDILAALEHPNIARLYDAGTTTDGQVYLALEYVDGQELTAYADQHQLGLRPRLELFRQVLDAVRYAHGRLTIHRDLKPSNILVTRDGQVRLLDFGVAKLIPEESATDPLMTEFGARAITPAYAAPEQLSGGAITIATDVYALGVVLYELLTGVRPYRLQGASRGALEDAIIAGEPRRPSQAIDAEQQAHVRAASVTRLRQGLRGDLDTIVLKALKKAADERFASVDAFIADIDNYLLGRPVLARPDSRWYRSSKFLRRNKLLAASAAAVVVALGVGLAIALWQAQEARRQASVAAREARKAEAVQGFLLGLFETNSDAQADPVKARAMTARELLDVGAEKLERELAAEPEVQAAVLDTLISMYTAIGLDAQAAQFQLRRLDVLKRLYGERDPRVAEQLIYYAEKLYSLEGPRKALQPLRSAQDVLDAQPGESTALRAHLLRVTARTRLMIAPADAARAAEEAIAIYHNRLPGDIGISDAFGFLGRARNLLGDNTGARAAYRESIEQASRPPVADITNLTVARLGLADVELELGQVEAAEALLRTAYAESAHRNGQAHVDTVHAETRLGALLHATGRRAEGRRLVESAAAKIGKEGELGSANLVGPVERNLGLALLADGRWQAATAPLTENLRLKQRLGLEALYVVALDDMAVLDLLMGRLTDARARLDQAAAIWKRVAAGKADPARENRFWLHSGALLLAQGDAAAAAESFRRVRAPRDLAAMPLDLDAMAASIGLGKAMLALGRAEAAQRYASVALARNDRANTRQYYPVLEADALLVLGRAASELRDHAAAQASLERALALRIANEDPSSAWIAEVQAALGSAALARGDRTAARLYSARAARIAATHDELGPQFRRPIHDLVAALRAH